MSKKALLTVGILLTIMGVIGFIPSWTWANIPEWLAVVKIVIGLLSVYISVIDKRV